MASNPPALSFSLMSGSPTAAISVGSMSSWEKTPFSMVPGSILQTHPVAKIFLDEAASSRLKKRDYYRWVFDHKPDWQRF